MKSKLLILFFAVISIYIFLNRDQEDHNLFSSDPCGYYLYLPAVFIYHDLGELSFFDSLNKKYNCSLLLYNAGNKKLDKYPIGVAFFELPFFICAHFYCECTHLYRPDGFSLPYQLVGIVSNVFWAAFGLFVLRDFLKKYFRDNVVAFTVLCVAFGTNLYAYTAFDVGMSHPYSFFLFSCLLNLADRWYDGRHKIHPVFFSIASGLVIGFIFIVRPINILAILVAIFWRVEGIASLKNRMTFFKSHYKSVLIVAFFSLLPIALQLSYWKYITGHLLYYSYQGEYFDFLNPHIVSGLFGYRKGWVIYSPMIILFFTGFYFLRKKDPSTVPILILFFVIMIYCVFSWREWWYGGGFGCRPLIETIAFLSFPFAAFADSIFYSPNKIRKAIFFLLAAMAITLNAFQTYQFSMGLIHWNRMTKEYYWRVFGKINFDRVKNEKYLIKETDENKYDD